MLRAKLVRLSKDEHLLSLIVHHIAFDGWSLGILNRELSVLYTAFSKGQSSPFSPLPIQYLDYAYWQQRWLNSDKIKAQSDYWREELAGAPALL